jgi:hypothetical protein
MGSLFQSLRHRKSYFSMCFHTPLSFRSQNKLSKKERKKERERLSKDPCFLSRWRIVWKLNLIIESCFLWTSCHFVSHIMSDWANDVITGSDLLSSSKGWERYHHDTLFCLEFFIPFFKKILTPDSRVITCITVIETSVEGSCLFMFPGFLSLESWSPFSRYNSVSVMKRVFISLSKNVFFPFDPCHDFQ